mgnify:CR=1 FL=1
MPLLPYMTLGGVVELTSEVLTTCRGDNDEFLDIMELLLASNIVRYRPARPVVNFNNVFDRHMDERTALTTF